MAEHLHQIEGQEVAELAHQVLLHLYAKLT